MIHYTASECIQLWQSWANRSRYDYNPDTLSRPGERDGADPRIAAYTHVEVWLMRNPDHAPDKEDWLLGRPNPATVAAFESWYKDHPHARTLSHEQVRSLDIRFEPLTLREAAEAYGKHHCHLIRAIQSGTLVAWRPRGWGWHTNRHELDTWVQKHPKGRNRRAS